jgi:hypothetical protein
MKNTTIQAYELKATEETLDVSRQLGDLKTYQYKRHAGLSGGRTKNNM